MKSLIRFGAVKAALLFALLGGCASGVDPTLLEGARLEVVGSPAVNLRYNQHRELKVRFVTRTGEPISGAEINFAIQGVPQGATISAPQVMTNISGEAPIIVTAGSTDVMFRVAATAPNDANASFAISIANADQGSIVVKSRYEGSRSLVRFETFLFEEVDCPTLNPHALPPALRMAPSTTDINSRTAFAGIPEGIDYAVGVIARNDATIAAFGCEDRQIVHTGQDTEVNILLEDIPILADYTGTWNLDNRFDFGGALPPSVDRALNLLDEITDDHAPADDFCHMPPTGEHHYGRDPGVYIVDRIARLTCRWECLPGEDFDSCSEVNHRAGDFSYACTSGLGAGSLSQERFTGGCIGWDIGAELAANYINEQLDDLLPEWVDQWIRFLGDLSRAIINARIDSAFTVNSPGVGSEFVPFQHELVTMHVDLHDPRSGETRMFMVPLRETGVMSVMASGMTMVGEENRLMIPDHSFSINFGQIVQYVYTEIFLKQLMGYETSEAMLLDRVNCTRVGEKLHESLGFGSASDFAGHCGTAMGALGRVLDENLGGFIDSDAHFTINGEAVGADINESTGRVGSIESGTWNGYWGERAEEGGMIEESISGTFTGARR